MEIHREDIWNRSAPGQWRKTSQMTLSLLLDGTQVNCNFPILMQRDWGLQSAVGIIPRSLRKMGSSRVSSRS